MGRTGAETNGTPDLTCARIAHKRTRDFQHELPERHRKIEKIGLIGRHDRAVAVPDPKYSIRAWRAVVTYLLRRNEFLYE